MLIRFLIACVCAGLYSAGTAEDKPKGDETALQGAWKTTVLLSKPAEPFVRCERVVFKGDKLTIHYVFNDKPFTSECTFKLDTTATPKRIDFTPTEGAAKGKTYLGIYELKDGKLLFSYRGPGSTRPKDFKDEAAGNDVTVGYAFEPEKQK